MGGLYMKKDLKDSNKEITVKCIYQEDDKKDGKDIIEILTASVLLFIGNEVKKNVADYSYLKNSQNFPI